MKSSLNTLFESYYSIISLNIPFNRSYLSRKTIEIRWSKSLLIQTYEYFIHKITSFILIYMLDMFFNIILKIQPYVFVMLLEIKSITHHVDKTYEVAHSVCRITINTLLFISCSLSSEKNNHSRKFSCRKEVESHLLSIFVSENINKNKSN
jgi:hypothetical protein